MNQTRLSINITTIIREADRKNYHLNPSIKEQYLLIGFSSLFSTSAFTWAVGISGPDKRSPALSSSPSERNGVNMVRLGGCRCDDDLGPVTDKTGRVHGRTVTTSSRGTRGRHSTSDLSATPTPLGPGFHHGTSTPSTHGYSHADFGVSSSESYIGRPVDRVCEGGKGFKGDMGLGEEHDRVQALHIEREADKGGDNGGDDDQDEGSWFIEVSIALHSTHRVGPYICIGIWSRHHVLMQRSLVGVLVTTGGVDISVLSHVCTRGQPGY
ncbi:hypothetical protein M9H77_27570 [Catharanthus roseus]|uniref:Uncharacterized protein n=1 Tax=Catharanthus roseus TaxID=4058 RepID=A0ACC0AEB4_CATRO|nr:hypothetical protein M9H77_27570 [Catharanthus roseus]